MYRLENTRLQVVWSTVLAVTLALLGCSATELYGNWAPIHPKLIGTWQLVEAREYTYYNQARGDPSMWVTYEKPLEIVKISLETITFHRWSETCHETETRVYDLMYNASGDTKVIYNRKDFSEQEENDAGEPRQATYVQIDDNSENNDEDDAGDDNEDHTTLAIIEVETSGTSELKYNWEHINYYKRYDGEVPPSDWPTTPCD